MAEAKRSKLAEDASEVPGVVAFRLLVPSSAVANVIGKGGEHIESIRSATRANIFVDDDAAGESSTLTFVGSEEACETAVRAVWALVQAAEADAARTNQYVALTKDGTALARQTLRMLISAFHAGAIIGKGGEQVRVLRDKHGTNVNVQSSDTSRAHTAAEHDAAASGERVVTITGPAAAVQSSRRDIWLRVCAMEPARRMVRGRPCTGALPDAGGRTTARATASDSAALTAMTGVPMLPPSASSAPAASTEQLVSEPLALPASLTGRLIGRAGSTVTAIRQRSGCAVVVSTDSVAEALGKGTDTHVVTLVGTLRNLAIAKELIARALAGENVVMGSGGGMSLGTAVPGFVSAGVVQKT